MENTDQNNRRKHERKPSDNPMEFVMAGDVINAVSVDISDGGIRLDTERPMVISLRFGDSGDSYEAKLVWARRKLDSGVTYGFEYLPAAPT